MVAEIRANESRRVLSALAAASIAISSAVAGGLTVEHDPEVDFSVFRTYAWSADKGLVAARADVQQAIVQSVDEELRSKGLTEVDPATADLHVVTYALGESWGGTVSGFYRPPDWSIGFITVDSRMVADGTLAIDLYDADEGRLVWHAVARATVDSREQAKRKVSGFVNKAFRKFPPPR
ncbi:MAG TPA: DUF4136 domain-containing protein [Candidatus Polarisedimenticolaceae bacterium]|nr:DUF4136 domain-containing protein [Candidatus Polarisedimenticolaceae bacterium]